MNKYEAAVPAHMRELWSAICAAETDAERDGLMRQWTKHAGAWSSEWSGRPR